jgi:hypothetical protein
MVWNKPEILRELRRLHKNGGDLSYNGLSGRMQPLVSAAAYHFGSYRRAVELAGIDYANVLRRPRWTRARIITLIKTAKRRGDDLFWSAVTRRRDELGKAAFAALQPRLFGKWQQALHAAGLNGHAIAKYRHWDRASIAVELKGRAKGGEPLASGALQTKDPGLHAAAVRHFGTYDAALRAAKLDPLKFRERRSWNKNEVINEIKAAARNGARLADSQVRRDNPALYGASIRLFGTFTAARKVAGVKFKPKKRKEPARSR